MPWVHAPSPHGNGLTYILPLVVGVLWKRKSASTLMDHVSLRFLASAGRGRQFLLHLAGHPHLLVCVCVEFVGVWVGVRQGLGGGKISCGWESFSSPYRGPATY